MVWSPPSTIGVTPARMIPSSCVAICATDAVASPGVVSTSPQSTTDWVAKQSTFRFGL